MNKPEPDVTQAVQDLSGTTVGRFAVRERLGSGGMGEVYRAEDTALKRPVALKRVAPHLRADSYYRERLMKEAERAAGLADPRIAAIYDVLEAEGELFLVMEYVEGETLRRRLDRPLGLDEFLPLALQCAEALETAHARGIAHRDLKPENIMLTSTGQVKVLDFGVARRLPRAGDATDSLTRGDFSGTPSYMAPEILLEKEADGRADIFSLGVVFYEALNGRHPFRAGSLAATTDRILHETPPPSALHPAVPAALDRVVARMLEKDPAARYATAGDLVADLRTVQHAATYSRVYHVARRGLKRRLALVAVALLLVALGIDVARHKFPQWWGGGRAVPAAARVQSLAVLPLVNISGNADQDYFADGMTEELITNLSRVGALRVISRSSVMRYKGTDKPLAKIAGELNVDAVVEGSVLRVGDKVRITAQLVHVGTDRALWGESYERDVRDVLALQSEVARAIVQEIEIRVTAQEAAHLASARPVKPEAYEAYLRGRYFWGKRTAGSVNKAIAYFEQAIRLDATYAPAYAGLADCYTVLAGAGELPPAEAYAKAKAAAQKALALDDTLAEAHTSLGGVRFFAFEWAVAEKELTRAIELNPGNASARHWHAVYLVTMGRFEEAIADIKRAEKLDPFSLIISSNVGWCLYLAGRTDEAIQQLQKTLELDPNFPGAHGYLAQAYLEKRMFNEAIAEFQRAVALSGGSVSYKAELGNAYAVAGRTAEARRILAELDAISKREYVPAYARALVYAGLGEKEQALAWLEKSYDERYARLVTLNVHPRFEPLRSEPRFQALLRHMSFPPRPR